MTQQTADPASVLDPGIALFIRSMSEGWAKHPPLDTLPFPEARKVAEAVRKPWTEGGPEMVRTTEYQVPLNSGDDTQTVRVRIYRPAGALLGALVHLHGGGWTIFSIDTHDRLAREYAGRAGIAVVAVDYSLSPEVRYPRALDETVAVVRWLRAEGTSLGIDPARIATGGDSAGANLAMAAALVVRDAGEPPLSAMLLNYGAFDTDCHNDSYRRFGGPGFMLGGPEMEDFWRNYLGERFDTPDPLAKPLLAEMHDLPPAFLCIPDCDVLLDENIAMGEKLRAAGVEVTEKIYPGASHSFLEAPSVAPIADQALDDAAVWLRTKLA